MSLTDPVAQNWVYDFGDRTATELGTAVSALETKINTARQQAADLITSGSYGSTTARYRVMIRADANSPQGYTIEIRLTT